MRGPICTGAPTSGRARCSYHQERRIVQMQISTLVGVVTCDLKFVYGLLPSPFGQFDHYFNEFLKVADWFEAELEEHQAEWRGLPLGSPVSLDEELRHWEACE